MITGPSGSENLSVLRSHIRRFLGDARHVVTDLTPEPLADVKGRRAFFATTAPGAVAARQVQHLESAQGVVFVDNRAFAIEGPADLEAVLDELIERT